MTATGQVYFVHIGLAKTGSSFLQTTVFPAHPRLRVYGTHGHARELDTHIERLWREEVGALDMHRWCSTWARRFFELLAAQGAGDRLVGISNERLAGHFVTGHNAFAVADRLHEALGPVRVFMVFRHPLAYLSSMYNQMVKQGSADGLASILADVINYPGAGIAVRLDYRSLYDYYRRVFGAEQVLALPQEMMRREPGKFFELLFRFLGVEGLGPEALIAHQDARSYSRENPSFSALSCALMRFLNYLGADRRRSRHVLTRLERRVIHRLFPAPSRVSMATVRRAAPALAERLCAESYALWEGELARYNYRFT